jgi:hypothetical protein
MMATMKNASDQRSIQDPPNVGFRNDAIYAADVETLLEIENPRSIVGESHGDGGFQSRLNCLVPRRDPPLRARLDPQELHGPALARWVCVRANLRHA